MDKMIFSDKVYCRVLSDDTVLSTKYYVNVLCGDVSGEVDVYSYGIAGACGQEFSFYYPEWKEKLGGTPTDPNTLLAMALSADGGWGHANEKCFVPNGDSDYIEREV